MITGYSSTSIAETNLIRQKTCPPEGRGQFPYYTYVKKNLHVSSETICQYSKIILQI